MDEYENMTDEEIWDAWQREKQASYEADMRAIRSGQKTRRQVARENSVFSPEAATKPLPWDEIFRNCDKT